MKRYQIVIMKVSLIISTIVAIGALLACCFLVHKDEFIYQYMLYDHIECNGVAYYSTSAYERPSSSLSKEKLPVYLVRSGRADYNNVYYAKKYIGYEGEEETVFVF